MSARSSTASGVPSSSPTALLPHQDRSLWSKLGGEGRGGEGRGGEGRGGAHHHIGRGGEEWGDEHR